MIGTPTGTRVLFWLQPVCLTLALIVRLTQKHIVRLTWAPATLTISRAGRNTFHPSLALVWPEKIKA
jgi:hypothetical protein